GLTARYARVVLALQDEERRADLRCVGERGALAVQVRVLFGIAKLAKQVLAQIPTRRLDHGLPRDDTDDRHARRETGATECERHEREISAVALAVHPDARRVGELLIAEPRGAARDVLEILAAPIAAIPFAPFLAVPDRSPRIRFEDDESRVDEDLRGDVPLAVVLRRRPSVDVDDRGWDRLAPQSLGIREEEERGYILAVRTRIADVRGLDERLGVDRGGQRTRDRAR